MKKVNFLIDGFQMNRFLDFHITCGDDDIRVHRFMLAANSHYFHGMFERAAEASHILLPHTAISPRFVRLIIDLIYTGVARMKRKVCYSYHSNFGLSLLFDSKFDDRNDIQVVNNLIASQDFEAFFEAAKYLNIKHLEGNLFLVSNRGEEAQAMNDGRLVASTRTPDEVLNASDEIADAEVAAAEIYSQRWVNPLTMYWLYFLLIPSFGNFTRLSARNSVAVFCHAK